jgi:hypothetical protein
LEDATHIFDGKPDARQSADRNEPMSRFRPRYRALAEDEQKLHDSIKTTAVMLETLFDRTPHGRYHALALTALEEAVMWAVKSLTANA